MPHVGAQTFVRLRKVWPYFQPHRFSFVGLVWLVFQAPIFALVGQVRLHVGVQAFDLLVVTLLGNRVS